MWPVATGFLIVAIGLALLGIIGIGVCKRNGSLEIGTRVKKIYG
ncbi:hypothetical protein [Staphylococcus argensis]|nr:hypothetical protein [Staphylococcus argensis]